MCGCASQSNSPAHIIFMTTNITLKPDLARAAGECAVRSIPASPLILIIEDHKDTREMMRIWLEMRGCRVVEAEDGESGVEQSRAFKPALILMDSQLPGMNGINTMHRIRDYVELREIPVIFVSGLAYPADYQAAFDAGCDDYLVKPFDLNQGMKVLERHLRRSAANNRRATALP